MLSQLSRKERLQLIRFVCSFAWADLEIRDKERAFIKQLVRRLHLDADEAKQVDGWLKAPPRPDEVDPGEINLAHRKLFLDNARAIIEADGQISDEERESLAVLKELLTTAKAR